MFFSRLSRIREQTLAGRSELDGLVTICRGPIAVEASYAEVSGSSSPVESGKGNAAFDQPRDNVASASKSLLSGRNFARARYSNIAANKSFHI